MAFDSCQNLPASRSACEPSTDSAFLALRKDLRGAFGALGYLR
jgi:hypothetical protein